MKANKFFVAQLIGADKIQDIEQKINSHDGINAARVDTNANTVTVDYDDGKYDIDDIKGFVNEAGVTVISIV